jgi:hypothetical protein
MLEPRCSRVDFFIDYGKVFLMNTDTQSQKERVIKSLAILGLLGLIIIIAWGSVQAVKYFPTAVQSLASLADSVYNYDVHKAPAIILKDTASSTKVVKSLWCSGKLFQLLECIPSHMLVKKDLQ